MPVFPVTSSISLNAAVSSTDSLCFVARPPGIQNVEFPNVKTGGKPSGHWALAWREDLGSNNAVRWA